ncbi:putative acyl carrier protein [Hesseltinella vesiculosa]|uniref:Acyl carrier protein n=1 Tax=Hesseltinella vesiculosa TaxID=101127 RepID=A0A1X2GGR0_9FUNG|nr:putative acyl carrier protein [Hesseltinella vesiculosa]
MFRPTVLLNAAAKASIYRSAPVFQRFYSAGALAQSDVESRILDILKGFDKVDQAKISLEANFANDLGLDSLDTVEVIMAIEEDFSVEIPDKEADDIKTVSDAVKYIAGRADAH